MNAFVLIILAGLIGFAVILKVIDAWHISPVRGVVMLIAAGLFFYGFSLWLSLTWPFWAVMFSG